MQSGDTECDRSSAVDAHPGSSGALDAHSGSSAGAIDPHINIAAWGHIAVDADLAAVFPITNRTSERCGGACSQAKARNGSEGKDLCHLGGELKS